MPPLSPVAANESQFDLFRDSDEVRDTPALSDDGGGAGEEQLDIPGEKELGGGGLQRGPAKGAVSVRV